MTTGGGRRRTARYSSESMRFWSTSKAMATKASCKPGALKHDFAGYRSRRITDEHRLVYKIAGKEVRIAACPYHYG